MVIKGRRILRAAIMAGATVAAMVAVVAALSSGMSAQIMRFKGQNVVPVYEGWEQNPDGSLNLLFGYYNRNHLEELDVPVGAANHFSPGEPDRGQPTHFLPQRSRFLFRIRVPGDFGGKELVWTLTSNGKTDKAYGTVNAGYFIDDIVLMNNSGAGGSGGGANDLEGNKVPTLTIEGEMVRHVAVGQPVILTAVATDDGVPERGLVQLFGRGHNLGVRCCPDAARGLRLSWFVYRGPNTMAFEPKQFDAWENYRDGGNSPYSAGWEVPPVPAGNRWVTTTVFSEPGEYVLRCLAHDGGLFAWEDVTVVVG